MVPRASGLGCFSPDGKRIVTGSSDKTARIWGAATGKELIRLEGHGGIVWSASFSADEQRIVTGSDDKTARIWDAARGKGLLRLKGHSDYIRSASFSADGKQIVTGSSDKTTRIWDAATGRELIQMTSLANGWFSLHFDKSGNPPRFRASGEGYRILRYRDRNEKPSPAPWIPHEWMAQDLIKELSLEDSPSH
jgi:WD40 repeat protein